MPASLAGLGHARLNHVEGRPRPGAALTTSPALIGGRLARGTNRRRPKAPLRGRTRILVSLAIVSPSSSLLMLIEQTSRPGSKPEAVRSRWAR